MSLNRLDRTIALVAIALSGACAPSGGAARESGGAEVEPEPEPEREPFRVLSPSEPVPSFRVVATNGTVIDSEGLVKKEPFVVVFFATWCGVCELKLPDVTSVLAESERIVTIGVSVDEPETWRMVPGYVARHRLTFPTVRGTNFPRFAAAYDPMQTVPVVAVVGRNGYLVDYQIGWSSTDRKRLAAAIEVARRIPANAPALYQPRETAPDTPPPNSLD